jgi:hypothetical protein
VVAPIRIDWTGPRSLVIEVDGGKLLQWRLALTGNPATSLFNAAAEWLPPAWWARRAPALTSALVDLALRAGRVRLTDRVAAGLRFRAMPQAVWAVEASCAVVAGRDLGPLGSPTRDGSGTEIRAPLRSLFAAGALVVQPAPVACSASRSRSSGR